MHSLRITAVGNFMKKLLSSDCFDMFLMSSAVLNMASGWTADGHLNKDFYTKEEWEDPEIRPYDLIEWAQMRPVFHELIRGKKAPASFTFVLQLKPDLAKELPDHYHVESSGGFVDALVLTIRYEHSTLTCLSGISMKTFTTDKTVPELWDRYILEFMNRRDISYELLA